MLKGIELTAQALTEVTGNLYLWKDHSLRRIPTLSYGRRGLFIHSWFRRFCVSNFPSTGEHTASGSNILSNQHYSGLGWMRSSSTMPAIAI